MNAIDSRTKYNLGCRFIESRTLEEFEEFFKELKGRIGEQIHEVFRREKYRSTRERKLVTFVSDKLEQYRTVFNRYFYRIAKLVHGVSIACRQYGLKHNNNPIERHNEDIKQRYKTMRHFKSAASADAFLKLRRVMYNFVRNHRKLHGRTPAEMAGIQFDLGRSRLAGLIKLCIAH